MISVENMHQLLFDNLDKLIQVSFFKDKKIILFGLNNTSFAIKKYLEKRNFSIYAYIDNNEKKILEINRQVTDLMPNHLPSKLYTNIQSKIIYAFKPEALLSDFDNEVVVLIASKYYPAMSEQLKKMGYLENIHIRSVLDFYGLQDVLKYKNEIINQVPMTKKEIRQVQLEIVAYIKKICIKNNLRYYMSGGTLLGAVRHKGYIPWDDDIDLVMPMDDYLKLSDILKEMNKYDIFTFNTYPESCYIFYMQVCDKNSTVKLWNYPFLVNCGISIDIFPLIGFPEEKKEMEMFFNQVRNLNAKYLATFMNNSVEDKENILYRKNLQNQIIATMQQFKFDSSLYVGYVLSKYYDKDIVPRIVYNGQTELQFESLSLSAPSGYHQYLKRQFGDYMKLPEKVSQKTTHNYRAYHL